MKDAICSRCTYWARGFNDTKSDMRSPMGRCYPDTVHDIDDWESTRFDESCERFKPRKETQ